MTLAEPTEIYQKTSLSEYVSKANEFENYTDLFDYFEEVAQIYGYETIRYHIFKQNYAIVHDSTVPVVHTFPDSWIQKYVDNVSFKDDPLVNQSFRSSKPIKWFDENDSRELSEGEEVFLNGLKEAGFMDGLAVPLFGPDGEFAYIGLGSTDDIVNLSDEEMYVLYHICLHTHVLYKDLAKSDELIEIPQLSGREQEVLKWVSRGKSNGVIAEILGISDHTVDTILRRCFKKLGVNSRISAVVKAIQYSIIRPE